MDDLKQILGCFKLLLLKNFMLKRMLLKLSSSLFPLQKDWTLVKAGTEHKKKLLRFQTISFRVKNHYKLLFSPFAVPFVIPPPTLGILTSIYDMKLNFTPDIPLDNRR